MVKASAGGGGRGIRMVERPEDLEAAVTAARQEALAFLETTAFILKNLLSIHDILRYRCWLTSMAMSSIWGNGTALCSAATKGAGGMSESGDDAAAA